MRGCPTHYRMFSRIPGLYLLDANSTLQHATIKNFPDIVKCPPERQNHLPGRKKLVYLNCECLPKTPPALKCPQLFTPTFSWQTPIHPSEAASKWLPSQSLPWLPYPSEEFHAPSSTRPQCSRLEPLSLSHPWSTTSPSSPLDSKLLTSRKQVHFIFVPPVLSSVPAPQ